MNSWTIVAETVPKAGLVAFWPSTTYFDSAPVVPARRTPAASRLAVGDMSMTAVKSRLVPPIGTLRTSSILTRVTLAALVRTFWVTRTSMRNLLLGSTWKLARNLAPAGTSIDLLTLA